MPLTVVLAAMVAVLIWGGSPVATKFAVETIPAMTIAVLRTVLGGVLALPILLALRQPLPADADGRRLLIVSSVCGFVAFPLLFTLGIARTSAMNGALILALQPIATGAIAALFDRRLPRAAWWLGCVIAFAGVAVLVLGRAAGTAPASSVSSLVGDLLLLAALIAACLGYVTGGKLNRMGYPSPAATYWGALLGSAALLPIVLVSDMPDDLRAASASSVLALIYLTVAVTIIGYVLWYWALGRGGIARVAPLQFLQPVSGVLLAILVLGENVTVSLGVAVALILAGVVLATRAPPP